MRNKILSMVSHVIITEENYTLKNWDKLNNKIDQNNLVYSSAPYVEGQAMISFGNNVHGIQVKGIIPDYEKNVTSLENNIIDGQLNKIGNRPYQISIGIDLAKKMSLKIGDKITLVIPRANSTMIGIVPRIKRFEVSSIFNFGMQQYDKNLVFIVGFYRLSKNPVTNNTSLTCRNFFSFIFCLLFNTCDFVIIFDYFRFFISFNIFF